MQQSGTTGKLDHHILHWLKSEASGLTRTSASCALGSSAMCRKLHTAESNTSGEHKQDRSRLTCSVPFLGARRILHFYNGTKSITNGISNQHLYGLGEEQGSAYEWRSKFHKISIYVAAAHSDWWVYSCSTWAKILFSMSAGILLFASVNLITAIHCSHSNTKLQDCDAGMMNHGTPRDGWQDKDDKHSIW